jgi:DNA-directed RNA polymerase specialized sigma24 family protein
MSKGLPFPTTKWSELAAVREGLTDEKAQALTELATHYRRPLMAYLAMKVRDTDRAQELCQEFFRNSLATDFFAKADQGRGRFRTFLKASVDRFLIDRHRREAARAPEGGFVSPNPLQPFPEPVNTVTPESVYEVSWIHDLIIKAIDQYRARCSDSGEAIEFDLLDRYIVRPCLDGDDKPSLQAMADGYGLTRKQAEGRLARATRELRELLLKEISIYSMSEEETAEEIADLYRALGSGVSFQAD